MEDSMISMAPAAAPATEGEEPTATDSAPAAAAPAATADTLFFCRVHAFCDGDLDDAQYELEHGDDHDDEMDDDNVIY